MKRIKEIGIFLFYTFSILGLCDILLKGISNSKFHLIHTILDFLTKG